MTVNDMRLINDPLNAVPDAGQRLRTAPQWPQWSRPRATTRSVTPPFLRATHAAVVLGVVLAVSACGKSDPALGDAASPASTASAAPATPASGARAALSVRVALPERVRWPLTSDANGNVAAWQEASVGSESTGMRLAEVRVNVGDVVKKGQVLAVFSGDTVRADVAQAQAALAEAQANAADAKGNAERALTLQETGALSQQQINQYQTTAKTAQARVEAARAVLAAQHVRGRNVQVLAPDDGIISARAATVGSVVSAGTELFRLIRQGRLEWRAEVAASDLEAIRIGQAVQLALPSGSAVAGTVRAIAPSLDAQTRNALVYVDLKPHPAVKAGMFARGQFELGERDALTVPQVAVVPRDGFNHVLVVQPDQRVRLLKVQAGRRAGERVEVLGDLPANVPVVVDGAGFLNDGDLVQVTPGAAAAPAVAAASAVTSEVPALAVPASASASASALPAGSASASASAPSPARN